MQVTLAEVANLLRQRVPEADPYAGYLASLLTGDMEEVPIALDTDTAILASKNLPAEYQIPEVERFLRLSNHLRIFDSVPPHELIAGQESAIVDFAALLNKIVSADSDFANSLASRELQAGRLSGADLSESRTYQEQYLDELADGGEMDELIDTARRYRQSSSETVQIGAKRHLALALLQQEGQTAKEEGADLALENLEEKWAESRDYIVASVAAESWGDYGLAESTLLRALETWPGDHDLRSHCRTFAMQRGSGTLRQILNETGGSV